jgi:hypothetical protein
MQLRLNHQAMTAATTIANDLNSARSTMREEAVRERENINAEKKIVMSAQQQVEHEYNLKVKEIEEKHQLLIRQQKEQEEQIKIKQKEQEEQIKIAHESLKKQQLEMERSKDLMQREYLATVERMERDADSRRTAVPNLPVSSPSLATHGQSFDIHTPRKEASSLSGLSMTSPDPFMTPPSSHHAHAPFELPSPLKPPPPPAQLPSAAALALRNELAAKLEEEKCRREFEREMMKLELEDAKQKALLAQEKAAYTAQRAAFEAEEREYEIAAAMEQAQEQERKIAEANSRAAKMKIASGNSDRSSSISK